MSFFPFGATLPWLIVAAVLAALAVVVMLLSRRTRDLVVDADEVQTIQMTDAPGQITPQDWMSAPGVCRVFDSIEAAGGEIRFVGGCVRDAVLKLAIHDIDLATTLQPEAAMAALVSAGLKVIPTGLKHGTITCLCDGQKMEITTLRRDVETDGRHATVAFTNDWKTDASRRDFTMNALSMTRDGIIYDYFSGLRDLAERNVIFIGDPNRRIEEDYLRILRFFRFTGRYGRIPPATAALAACQKAVAHLDEISGERIQNEMFRLLQQTSPGTMIDLMAAEKVLPYLIPAPPQLGMLNSLVWLESRAMGEDRIAPDPVRRLAALLFRDSEAAASVAGRWRLSNARRDQLLDLCEPDLTLTPELDQAAMLAGIHRLGQVRFRDHLLLAWANDIDQSDTKGGRNAGWRRLFEAVEAAEAPEFPLMGADVLDAGVAPGPAVGQILAELEAHWLKQGCRPTRADLLDRLPVVIAARS
ncbi:MAG: CCA tRNA nucleotidyltransferase [Rhodospirillales bacterium]